MRFPRLIAVSLVLVSLSGCSSCSEKPVPDPKPEPVAPAVDAGVASFSPSPSPQPSVPPSAMASERPFDYPVVDDAPDWAWPPVQVIQLDGKQKLQVVGWSKNIANPQLAMSVAQAKAQANLVKAMKDRSLNQPGASEGSVAGVSLARSFRSKTGAVFSSVVMDLP